jgi:hypothetical protein
MVVGPAVVTEGCSFVSRLDNFTLKLPESKLVFTPRQGEPDFSHYPYPGLMRCLYQAYYQDLPYLESMALDAIKRGALRDRELDRKSQP